MNRRQLFTLGAGAAVAAAVLPLSALAETLLPGQSGYASVSGALAGSYEAEAYGLWKWLNAEQREVPGNFVRYTTPLELGERGFSSEAVKFGVETGMFREPTGAEGLGAIHALPPQTIERGHETCITFRTDQGVVIFQEEADTLMGYAVVGHHGVVRRGDADGSVTELPLRS